MPDGLALISFHSSDHTVHVEKWWGPDVALDFYFHAPDRVTRLLQEAGLEVESTVWRQPGQGGVQTECQYLLLRRSPVAVRPATEGGRPFLRNLHYACYRPSVEKIWGWDEADQDRRFAATWTTRGRAVVELSGQPIGALKTSRSRGHILVEDLEIHPDHQGRGIGTRLLRRVLADADAQGICRAASGPAQQPSPAPVRKARLPSR
jgi:GNAT superfamily N-acetyltransferase